MKHYAEICEPYEYEKENATTGGIEIIKKLSDCINTDRSLLKLVRIFIKEGPTGATGDEVVDEDEDQQNDQNEFIAEHSDGDDDDNPCDNLNSELHLQQQQTAAFLTSKKHKKQNKYKEWRMDTLRVDDLTQMRLMAKELSKMRKIKEKHGKKGTKRQQNETSVMRPMSAVPE